MCLYSNSKRLKIAKKKIECVKVVRIYTGLLGPGDSYEHYTTPFSLTTIDKRQIEGKKAFKAEGDLERGMSAEEGFEYRFGKGLIHVYRDLEEAKKHFPSNWFSDTRFHILAFKCYIKPGTRYIEGEDNLCAKTYGAKKIFFGEKLEF